MIEQWEFLHFPCQKDPLRYKLKVKTSEEHLAGFIRKLGVQCGRPFVSLSKDYNWAFYLYQIQKQDRNKIIKILKEFSDKGSVQTSAVEISQELPPALEEILDETARALISDDGISGNMPAGKEEPAENISKEIREAQRKAHAEEKPIPQPAADEDTEEHKLSQEQPVFEAEPEPAADIPAEPAEGREKFPEVRLNKLYIFNNFVVGPNNRFTHAAAQAVAKNPGKIYNPLFIYGGVGLGKTHLMHAVGHYVMENNAGLNLTFMTTEKFMGEVIEAIGNGTMPSFRERFNSIDVLLIDDIQFLSESEATQEEFFHIFNVMHEANKQIIITSDRPPKQLMTLEDRLRSRFEWGLIADIKSPNLETRVAILKKKISGDKNKILDENMLLYIASKLKSNIRELEGFLKRINAYAELTGQTVNIDLVKSIMKELLPEEDFDDEKQTEIKPLADETPPAEQPSPHIYTQPAQGMPPPSLFPVPPAVSPPLKPAPIGFSVPSPSAPPATPPRLSIGPGISKLSGQDADPSLTPIEVGLFYPENHEKEFAIMKEKFKMIIKKHKLKFRLDPLFEKSYPYAGKINYTLFTETCKSNNVRIMLILGPPPDAAVIEDDFTNLLAAVMEDERISLQLVSWQEKEKDYRYLNLSLDITLLRHRKLDK
ncbi:MAG: chromosomal replication initiator protein DnaA [bacterium]